MFCAAVIYRYFFPSSICFFQLCKRKQSHQKYIVRCENVGNKKDVIDCGSVTRSKKGLDELSNRRFRISVV